MDFGRIFEAVLSGAAQRPRGTPSSSNGGRPASGRRGSGPFGMTQAETRQIGRAIGALAGIAAEALSKSGTPSRPTPAPIPGTGGRPAPQRPVEPARRIPEVTAKTEPTPAASAEGAEARLLLRAMIAAARADGSIDKAERIGIGKQLDAAGLNTAERDQVLAEFDRPASIEELAQGARDALLKAQLYAAAYAAVGEMSAGERAWLDRLAAALKLDPAARKAIEQRLGS